MLEYYQKALRTSEEVPGLDRPSTAATCNNPGVLALMNNLYRGISAYIQQGNSLNDLDDDAVNWIEE